MGGRVYADIPGAMVIENSHVLGRVDSRTSYYTGVYNSVIERAVKVSPATEGAVFCRSEAYGNVRYADNSEVLQIGADGPVAGCLGASYFGQNVDISDNTAQVVVSGTFIRDDLSGTGNVPAPSGENNRVRGTRSGQFVHLAPPEAMRARAATAGAGDVHDRAGKVSDSADQRRAAAQAQVGRAGSAGLGR